MIEGRLRPHERRAEGPFGEFKGYYSPINENGYIFDISEVIVRPNAVFHGLLCGTAEDLVPLNTAFAMRTYVALKDVEGFIDVLCDPLFLCSIIQIRKTDDAQPRAFMERAFAALPKYTYMCIVIDEDVGLNLKAVMHAFLTRRNLNSKIIQLPDPSDPSRTTGGRVGLDATSPIARRAEMERASTPGSATLNLAEYISPNPTRLSFGKDSW